MKALLITLISLASLAIQAQLPVKIDGSERFILRFNTIQTYEYGEWSEPRKAEISASFFPQGNRTGYFVILVDLKQEIIEVGIPTLSGPSGDRFWQAYMRYEAGMGNYITWLTGKPMYIHRAQKIVKLDVYKNY